MKTEQDVENKKELICENVKVMNFGSSLEGSSLRRIYVYFLGNTTWSYGCEKEVEEIQRVGGSGESEDEDSRIDRRDELQVAGEKGCHHSPNQGPSLTTVSAFLLSTLTKIIMQP